MFEKHGIVGRANHAVKGMVLPGKLQILIRAESLASLFGSLRAPMNARIDDMPGIPVRKRIEQHVVDNAENGRAGANTEPEGNNRHQGETRVATQLAQRIAQV